MKEARMEKLLKDHGLRVTQTRKDVLSVFLDSEAAISNQVIEQNIFDIDRITLYRTLKSFEEKGVIHKAVDGTDLTKYALCEEHCSEEYHQHDHVHFHCEKCEKTFCVDEVHIPDFSTPKGYTIRSANVILNGTCENCV